MRHCGPRYKISFIDSNMTNLLAVLALIILVASCEYLSSDAASLGEEFDHAAWLDENQNYKLYWTVKHADESIYLAAEVKTTGWIGFGISQGLSGMMRNADIAIAWVDATGKAHLKDCHAKGNVRPELDAKQDYQLISSWQSSNVTVIKFRRKFSTCDEKDRDVVKGVTRVIYAIGDKGPAENSLLGLQKHKAKGSRSLNLLNYVKNRPVPVGTKYFDIVQRNVKVLAKETVYWCQAFKIADLVHLNTTQHIIEIAPLVQKGSEGLIHHIVVYTCKDDFDETHLNVSGECYGNMPKSVKECIGISILAAWDVGGGNFRLPDEAGYPIGGVGTIKYVLMETHFDNPLKMKGHVDTSGLRFYYSSPRKYEAGSFGASAGISSDLLIPPQQTSWTIVATCSKECTMKMKDSGVDKVRIFASFPHAHLAGTKIRTILLRDGVEEQEIFRIDNYDFNYQQYYLLEKPVELRAGDELITYCDYNTMDRKDATIGGFGSYEEMCANFLVYYPRANLKFCGSSERLVREEFELKYGRKELNASAGHTMWTGIEWNSTMLHELKAIYQSNSSQAINDFCLGDKSIVHFDKQKPRPIIKKRLEKPTQRCLYTPSSAVAIQFTVPKSITPALYCVITSITLLLSAGWLSICCF